jgi:hypothetical protein
VAIVFAGGIAILPLTAIAAAALASRWSARATLPLHTFAASYVFAFLPFGFAVWVAHYGFHLLTGAFTVVPVTQAAAIDLFGSAALGEPAWRLVGMRAGTVLPLQLGLILLGSFGSAGLVRAISQRDHGTRAAAAAWPWFVVLAVLAVLAGWIFLQPMEMRGTMVS